MLAFALIVAAIVQPEAAPGPILDRIVSRMDESDRRHEERYEAVGDRIRQLADAVVSAREELANAREDWRPLQTIVDRLISLGWKLILLVVLFAVLIEGTRLLVLWLVQRWLWTFQFRKNDNA